MLYISCKAETSCICCTNSLIIDLKLILKGIDNGLYYSELPVFRLCPLSGILKSRKHGVSETGSVSIFR
jgi:hypothetical protein